MKRYLLYVLGGGIACGLLWAGGLFLFMCSIPLAPQPFTFPTDGMVIFTGGKMRLQTALSLFQQKRSKYLLISGANPGSSSRDIIGEVPFDPYITLGYQALDTIGNAEETAVWAKARRIKTLRLITSNYHMPRSLLELQYRLPNVQIIPEPVVGQRFLEPYWWTTRSLFVLITYEYNKFLLAGIRHVMDDLQKIFIR